MAEKKNVEPASIAPEALYQIEVSRPFEFGGVSFGKIARNEISGEFLAAILDSDKAERVKSYRASASSSETSAPAPRG